MKNEQEIINSLDKKTIYFILEVENHCFRTIDDVGGCTNARYIWNWTREHYGLPTLTKEDLAFWRDDKKDYVMPENSKLLSEILKRVEKKS